METKRDSSGRFIKGVRYHPETEFKKGEHWREKKLYWDKNWLKNEYTNNFRSAKDIADQFGITEAAILHWLRKHKIPRRKMQDIRAKKHWDLSGEKNGMFGRNGENNPNWKGGITPDRQEFYISNGWKNACSAVYKRDGAQCQRCGKQDNLHVHHIVGFSNKEMRADENNLILLCVDCHRWVHSNKNIDKKYIGKEVQE